MLPCLCVEQLMVNRYQHACGICTAAVGLPHLFLSCFLVYNLVTTQELAPGKTLHGTCLLFHLSGWTCRLLCCCPQTFFKVNGPVVQLPQNMTDVTTAATIIQLAVPDLKLVLDPMLYLKAMQRPKGIPKVIHMTLRSKHSLAPHQILSIISWGWYNKGYALLLYDNSDITAYMQRFYPGFMPSEWKGGPDVGDKK